MIDRDYVIDLCAAIDTAFMKQAVGTYNEFDKYATFALYVEAKVRAEEREACARVAESYEPRCDTCPSGVSNAIRARGQQK